MAAEQVNDKRVEDNSIICDGKSFENFELQQLTTEVQIDEAAHSQGNWDTFQQGNSFHSQQSHIVSTGKPVNEFGIQRQIPFQIENYANQILGQKLTQMFTGTNNVKAESITEQAALSQTTGSLNDRQTINDEIVSISKEAIKNSPPKLQEERSGKNGNRPEMVEDENSKILNFEHQQFEKCPVLSQNFNAGNSERRKSADAFVTETNQNMILENEPNLMTKAIFIGLQFANGKLFDVIGGLSSAANDPQHQLPRSPATNPKSVEVEGEVSLEVAATDEKFQLTASDVKFPEAVHSEELLATANHTDLRCISPEVANESGKIRKEVAAHLRDRNSVQYVVKSTNANEFQNANGKLVESEKIEEQRCDGERDERVRHGQIEDGNVKTLNESFQMISAEGKLENFDASKGSSITAAMEDDERSNVSSTDFINGKCEKVVAKAGVAVDSRTVSVKSSGSLQAANRKNSTTTRTVKLLSQQGDKSVNATDKRAARSALSKLHVKTTRKTSPTTVTVTSSKHTVIPTGKSARKSNHTKLASTTTAIPMDKNIDEVGLKQTKKIANIRSKDKLTPTRISAPLKSKLIPNRTESQLNYRTEIDVKTKLKNIVRENQKTESDGNVLMGSEKKIGVIDASPLVWTEILVPTYEQIWECCDESTNYIINEIPFEFEKMKTENFETKNAELAWEVAKDSEFTKIQATALANGDEINESECFNSLNNEVISEFLKIKEEEIEEVDVEEEIAVESSSEIEIFGSVSIKSSEAAELSLKVKLEISSEQKTVMGQASDDADIPGHSGNDAVPMLKSNLLKAQSGTETATDKETTKLVAKEDSNKTEGATDGEREKEMKQGGNDECKESGKTEGGMTVLTGLKCEQQMQPEMEKTDGVRGNDAEYHSKRYQPRSQFGRMHSDVLEGGREHKATGKNISRKHQEGSRQQQRSSQEICDEISDNVQLQGNNHDQQQTIGNQHRSQKQPDNVNDGHSRNYTGQQGHKKRNKRNRKSRNW